MIDRMAKFTIKTLSLWIGQGAPSGCCDLQDECMENIVEEVAMCKRNDQKPAARDAHLVRLGKNPERIGANRHGGGRKKWYPSSDTFYALAELESEIETANLIDGVYHVYYGSSDGQTINEDEPLILTLEWDPSAGSSASASPTQPTPAEPRIRQTMLEDVHRHTLERAKIDEKSLETHQKTARRALRIVSTQNEKFAEATDKLIESATKLQAATTGLVENVGMHIEAAQRTTKKILIAALDAEPPKPLAVQIVEAVGGLIEKAGEKYLGVLAEKSKSPPPATDEKRQLEEKRPLLLPASAGDSAAPFESEPKVDADLPFELRMQRLVPGYSEDRARQNRRPT